MEEQIIVTLTTWRKRIGNIPTVLDTIFNQSLPPDFVVLNLAFDESIPNEIQEYIDTHNIEINRGPDTKVYKKLIPTLRKYPHDCVISIDDDWLYPKNMIEDFMHMHRQYPNYPISGNKSVFHGLQCHCGCASLQKTDFFADNLDLIDDEVINNCPSDDLTYTYFSNKAGRPYIRTKGLYFTNLTPYNNNSSYSKEIEDKNGLEKSYRYLVKKYGDIDHYSSLYPQDIYGQEIIEDIIRKCSKSICEKEDQIDKIYKSNTFRLGSALISPFRLLMKK